MKPQNQCVECGKPAPHNLICAACLPEYGETKLTDDVCQCVSWRSDVAGFVPCERGDDK